MNNKKGRLIVIEGACDGIGKSTQLALLQKYLGESCITHHFPTYGTPGASAIETFLRGDYGPKDEIPDELIQNMYALDRAILWQTKLKREYEAGKTLLLDRYTTSSLIYQTLKCPDDEAKKDRISQIKAHEYGYLKVGEPDLIVFLNGDFDTLTKLRLARLDNDGIQGDVYERDIETQRQIYNNAQFVSNYLKWYQVMVTENDNMRSKEAIHEDIMRLVRKK